MDAVKPYVFYYTNLPPPFEPNIKYREGINQILHENEACVQVVTWNNMTPLKVKVLPDDGKNEPKFLMGIVATRFDSTLNIEHIPGEDSFKVWNKSMLLNSSYRQIWGELTSGLKVEQKNKLVRFREVHNQFYNMICAPDRDVYAVDVMLHYLGQLKKP